MVESQKAAFSFQTFNVPKFSYDGGSQNESPINILFIPSGKYNSESGEFELTLSVISHDAEDEKKVVFALTSAAIFKFESVIKFEEIPPYFYKNAIAIMFPYVRAFISTLTLQANIRLLNLGLMNLSNLEIPLIENTTVI